MLPHPNERARSACRDRRGHHPWAFAGRYLPDWRIHFTSDLPVGHRGLTVWAEQRIFLAAGMNQAERRSTLAHETGHVLRGPSSRCLELYEEALVERQAGRLLLPSVRRIGHSLAWHRAVFEGAAEDLWVDEQLLNARLSTLAPTDRRWLDEQLQHVWI